MLEAIFPDSSLVDGTAVLPVMTAVLSNAIIASLIAILAWIGSRLYRRPALWHAVWVIALLKLFLPPIWSIPVTLFSEAQPNPTPVIVSSAGSEADSGINPTVVTSPQRTLETTVSAKNNRSQPPEAIEKQRGSLPDLPWAFLLSLLWALGSLGVFLLSAKRIVRFNALVQRSAPADAATDLLLHSLIARFCELPMRPHVRLVDQIIPPLLWPVGRTPTIVLPSMWWKMTTQEERKTVLIHELVHWRRGDHWVRLLQWIASIAFWWHPLVWIARGALHHLEEQCCDAEVMHRLPAAGRSYASALLSASRMADDNREPNLLHYQPLAMPMSHLTKFESFHRRIEMLPSLRYHPWTPGRLAAIFLSAVMPLAIGLSVSGQPPAAKGDQVKLANKEPSRSKVVGHVTDLDGQPIVDAKVRVVIPSAELRFPVDQENHREIWGNTNATGSYSIDVGEIEKDSTASIDILHPGHRRLVGTLKSGGTPNKVPLSRGGRVEFDAKLPTALYFAGKVVDEGGKPLEGVSVASSLGTKTSRAGIERSVTDAEGRFAVYGYESEFLKDHPKRGKRTAAILFQHDRYIDADLEKLEDLDPSKREDLRVVMQSGYTIAGTVHDLSDRPATDVVVSINQRDPGQRKAALTDSHGRFRFDGVDGGKTTLRVVDVGENRKSIEEFAVDANNTEIKIRLKPIELPSVAKYQVLGMTLANVTTAMNEAYDLRAGKTKGVMIFDPGNRTEDFAIGELRSGYVFWMVGNDRVRDLKALVSKLVQEAKSPTVLPDSPGNTSAWIEKNGDARVRVVYSFDNQQMQGTNTQYMRLTPQDVAELERLNERFKITELE